ncbi:hypothetical protein [Bacillus solitudinis]|uniref:hypothetical protein n=1 Tax=Bacillus solitudinis TaxID=2014074 RepID=UPI000C233191|nr:hypothetical protein [Bacillus solitudinis]
MFRDNKIVLLLPAILMVVMVFGGYYYLNNTDVVTNEELEQFAKLDSSIQETENGWEITAEWDWTMMPTDGLYGEDYLGIHLGENIEVVSSTLKLYHADGIVLENEGAIVENGVIFSFPNEIIENEVLGNRGTAVVKVEKMPSNASIHLLHTWTAHSPLEKNEASLSNPLFGEAKNVPYWTLKTQVGGE